MTSVVMPICMLCKHFREPKEGDQNLMCNAYPVQIPQAILMSQVDHREPYAGDHGFQFEAVSDAGTAYAKDLFDLMEA